MKTCEYEDSAENRILECLSASLYSKELFAGLSPANNAESHSSHRVYASLLSTMTLLKLLTPMLMQNR
uniref:Uncharacterized protein n=1 Tax=Ditylenchus dipsaci TaxID=166011 RepID=A0A915DUY1_9BILA